MEKVCLPFWRRAGDDPAAVADWAVATLAPLLAGSASVRAATLHVEAAEHPSLRHGAPADGTLLAGLASVWLDSYQDAAEVTDALAAGPLAGWHGYLVCESVPRAYGEAFAWSEGERSPGLSLVTLLAKPASLDEAEFYRLWHDAHRRTTAECHPFWCYVRNEVARPLTGGPPFRGVVTEAARTAEDLTDPHRFYVSGGDRERLKANQRRVFGEVAQFIDMATIEVVPAHEHVLRRLAGTSP